MFQFALRQAARNWKSSTSLDCKPHWDARPTRYVSNTWLVPKFCRACTHTHLCVHKHIHLCVHKYIHICRQLLLKGLYMNTHTNTYRHIQTHKRRHTNADTLTCRHTHADTHADTHTQTHTRRHTHADTHTQTHTRRHTHTHTHTQTHTHKTHTRRHAYAHKHPSIDQLCTQFWEALFVSSDWVSSVSLTCRRFAWSVDAVVWLSWRSYEHRALLQSFSCSYVWILHRHTQYKHTQYKHTQ